MPAPGGVMRVIGKSLGEANFCSFLVGANSIIEYLIFIVDDARILWNILLCVTLIIFPK